MKIILTVFFIFCILPAWGQTVEIDSLKSILTQLERVRRYEKNKLYFNTLHELCGAIYAHKPDTSLLLSERLQQLAQKASDKFWEAKGIMRVAYYYLHGRDLTKAIAYIDEAIAIFRQLQSKEGLALAFRIKAEAYLTQSLNDKALTYLFEALQFSNQIVPKEQANARREGVLHRLGDIYQTLGEYKKAKDYYAQGLDFVAQHAPNSFIQYFILVSLNNILIQEKQYEEAIKNYRYILAKSPKHLKMIFYASYKGLGDIYKATNQRDSAKFYFKNALEAVRAVNNPVSLTPILHVLAVLYMDEKDYDNALRTEEEMLAICEKFNVRDSKNIAYGLLADIHKSKGNYQQAFLYHQKFKKLSDSLAHEQNNREIGKMEANYEFSKKEMVFLREQEIKKLETEQLRKDILLQEVETEKQTLLASQTTERNKYLLAENQAKEQEKKQQARVFEAEKKRKELENQQKLAQQRWYAYLLAGGLGVVLVVLFLIWRNNQQKQKANRLLTQKNAEILQQKEEIITQAEMLDMANKTKDQLFSIIAHDLRSPMTAFQGLNTQIQYFLRKNQPEKLQELGNDLEESTQRLNNLLNNLLQWAMVQRNVMQIDMQSFNLQEAVNHTFEHFKWIAQTHHIALVNNVLPTACIQTDYNILQTILRNLISNAIKFTREGGQIIVEGQASLQAWQLSVQDTGVGMSQEKLQTLFGTPQINSTKGVRGERGIGIGLQLCYELSQSIGAILTVQSVEGEGTVFHLVSNSN